MKAGFVLSPTLVEACRFLRAIFTAHLTITSVVALTAYRGRRRYNLLKVAMIGIQGDDISTCLNPGDQIIPHCAVTSQQTRIYDAQICQTKKFLP